MIWHAEMILAALCIAALAAWLVQAIVDERASAAPPKRIRPHVQTPPPAPAPLNADLPHARIARADRAHGRHRRPEEPS
ncbi:hypothetical protein ABZ723_15610 [Streptomyces sp. NPDC006700]|uniref:hypothetical protein n=1 Tax=unclassified Streptomyces TaxID=2593676 RepID=UPI0033E06E1B